MAMNVKKGDTVIVLSGKDKGKQGKVLGTVPSEAKVVVEGINMVTCHVKPRKQGETGGIVQREAAMYAFSSICSFLLRPTAIHRRPHANNQLFSKRPHPFLNQL